MRFTVTNRSGKWAVFDNTTRRYYYGYRNIIEAECAAEEFNNAELMASNQKAALL